MVLQETRAAPLRHQIPFRFRRNFPPRRRSIQPVRNFPNDSASTASKPSTPASKPASAGLDIRADGVNSSGAVNLTTPAQSGAVLLTDLQTWARNPSTFNVYGKPFTKTELAALDAAVSCLSSDVRGLAAASAGTAALQHHLLNELLLNAAVFKHVPLPVVEGGMALLEVMKTSKALNGHTKEESSVLPTDPLLAASASGSSSSGTEASAEDDPALLSRYRWQLVVGADVGGVQYIPAVEELEVSPDGSSFTLGTDLDFIFTDFRGPCEWRAPGHLSYNVRQVRIEFRWPKAWRRAAAWLSWRQRLGSSAPTAEPEWSDSLPSSPTCREDLSAPAATLPLPFPTNELLTFSCNGQVAATRSRLTNGLILLLEVQTRERLRNAVTNITSTSIS